MKKTIPYSTDDLPHAFVDQALDAAAAEHCLQRMQSDPDFRREVCELRILKDTVRASYPLSTQRGMESPAGFAHSRVWGRFAFAACLVLAVGILLGWGARGMVADPLQVQLASLRHVEADPGLILFHVDNGDPVRFARLLERARQLLDNAGQAGSKIQVAVLVNSGGIDMLRAVSSPHAAQIHAMQSSYPNLSFIGCSNTLARLRETGHDVRLLPGVAQGAAAIDVVVERLKNGWTYIKA